MDLRNFFSRDTLQPGMIDEWSADSLTQSNTFERVLLPGFDATSGHAVAVPVEERALVDRARAGDQDAFGVLVRLHQRQVFNLALRMLHDRDEASEATQEVFLAAWLGLRGFRGDARFATWLYRIAYNYCLRSAERRRRDASAQAELAAQSAREHSPESRLSALHARNAEQVVRETVQVEIANLPPKYRLVLVLRHLQDLSYEEIAEVMRVPIGTVKTQLFRARALLKERLQGLERVREESLTRAGELRAGIEAGLRGMLLHARELSSGEDE